MQLDSTLFHIYNVHRIYVVSWFLSIYRYLEKRLVPRSLNLFSVFGQLRILPGSFSYALYCMYLAQPFTGPINVHYILLRESRILFIFISTKITHIIITYKLFPKYLPLQYTHLLQIGLAESPAAVCQEKKSNLHSFQPKTLPQFVCSPPNEGKRKKLERGRDSILPVGQIIICNVHVVEMQELEINPFKRYLCNIL